MAGKTRPGTTRSAASNLPPEIKSFLDAGDVDSIENAVMEQVEEAPEDHDYYLPVLRALVQRGETDRAELLLDLVIEACSAREQLASRDDLLREVLVFWPEHEGARKLVAEHIRSAYPGTTGFDDLLKHCRVTESPEPLKALKALELWLRFAEGSGVFMPTKGVGRVVELNASLSKIRVAFQDDTGGPMSFKLDEAERLLEVLPAGHFLLEKLNNLAGLRELAQRDAGETLRKLFTSANRPLTVTEIKEMMAGVVPASRWTSWWGKARDNPRMVVGSGTRPTISWSDSASDAEAAVGERFAEAGPREKLEMARKHAGRSEELDKSMAAALVEAASRASTSDPSLALEMLLAAGSRFVKATISGVDKAIGELVGRNSAAELIAGVGDRALRRRAVILVRDLRQDWRSVYFALLRTETDTQTLSTIYEAVAGTDEQGELERLVRQTARQPIMAPGFSLWLSREMTQRAELKPLMDMAHLQGVLQALNDPSVKEFHAQFRKLFDPGGSADLAARLLNRDDARQLLTLLERDTTLEEYRKDQLHQDLHMWHPDLTQVEKTGFYVTAEALEAKREEFRKLIKEDLPQNAEEIKKAKAWGDLRENFEYHAARAKQELLSSRAKTLEDQLGEARALDLTTVDPSSICVGTRVRLEAADEGGEDLTITVLGPWDSDPGNNILSYTAPAVAALLGKKIGNAVSLNHRNYRIGEISVWRK